MDVKVKGMFGASVAIGAGFVIGKYCGGIVTGAIDGITQGMMIHKANNGSKFAAEYCDKYDIAYKKDDEQ